MILVAFRHGLKSSELTDLHWDQVDFTHAVLHVHIAKKGTPATHPVVGDEMRALRKLQREQDPNSPFVFTSERGSPITTAGFARRWEPFASPMKIEWGHSRRSDVRRRLQFYPDKGIVSVIVGASPRAQLGDIWPTPD